MINNKKIIVKVLYLFMIFISMTLLISCKDDEKPKETEDPVNSKQAYGYVHNHYIGIVEMYVVGGNVVSIRFDEAFTPYTWAQEITSNTITDTIKNSDGSDFETSSGVRYAKYLKIGDKLFTGTLYSETEKDSLPNGLVVKYSADGISDLYQYLKTEANAKWYVEQIYLGKVYVSKASGDLDTSARYNPQGSFFKSSSTYWTTGTIGWAKNMQLLTHGIIGTKMNATPSLNSDGVVIIGDLVTGSTIAGYSEYYNLAKIAYNK